MSGQDKQIRYKRIQTSMEGSTPGFAQPKHFCGAILLHRGWACKYSVAGLKTFAHIFLCLGVVHSWYREKRRTGTGTDGAFNILPVSTFLSLFCPPLFISFFPQPHNISPDWEGTGAKNLVTEQRQARWHVTASTGQARPRRQVRRAERAKHG